MENANDIKDNNIKARRLSSNVIIINVLLVLSIVLAITLSFRDSKPVVKQKKTAISFISGGPSVKVIDVYGIIEYQKMVSHISLRLKSAEKNDNIKAVILRINSGGGTVGASQAIYRQIHDFKKKTKKPVVAVIGDIAASGGYYIASAADSIIAGRGSLTGSIGVIIISFSFKDLFKKLGIKQDIIKSGEFKDIMTAIGRDKTPAELKLLQRSIDSVYKQFFDAVLANREGKKGLTDKILKAYADGRVIIGSEANDLGLVDSLGGMKEAIKYIKDKLKIKGELKVIYDSKSIFDKIFSTLGVNNESLFMDEPLSIEKFLKFHSTSGLPLYLYVGGNGL